MSRSLIWGSSLLLAIFMMVATPGQKANAQPGVSVSFQTFYDALSPHGQWIDDPDYGYVWSPRGVGRDFRPYYSGGSWAMTDYGNTWVSDYPWGWAPFHYGRWAYSPFYGWLWVPGNSWGPAWVHWRGGGSNYGWAPMGPGVNININIGGGGYYPPNNWWTFVPCNRIYHRGGYGRYWRGPQYNNTYINNTTIINNTYINNNNTYVIGPRRGEVERVTGQRINVYNVRNDGNPGRSRMTGRDVTMYRPEVRQDRGASYRPQNVVRADRSSNHEMNGAMRSDRNTAATERSRMPQNGWAQEAAGSRSRDRQVETGNVQQRDAQVAERANRDRDMRAAQRQRDAQMQQEQAGRSRDMRAEQQQRDAQVAERSNRERDMRAEQQQRDAQVQERSNREREMRAAQQQRDAQMQQEQASRNRDMQMERERFQAQADRQREQQRIQQQRETEQRARQQQQIESRRQQHYEQPQQRTNDRGGSVSGSSGGAMQRTERTQPGQQPAQTAERSGAGNNTGRRR